MKSSLRSVDSGSSSQNHESSYGGYLNISDQKLANFKSPMFLKLESMIQTLDKFRHEMDGNRVPKYEQHFIEKRKREEEIKRQETKRKERHERRQKREAEKREYEMLYRSGSKRRLLGENPHQKRSTIELFNSYKINEYNYQIKKPSKPSETRVTFYDEKASTNARLHGSLLISPDMRNRLLHKAINSQESLITSSGQYLVRRRKDSGFDSVSSLTQSFYSQDSNGKKRVKRLPGETREMAEDRVAREKEIRRVQKLMKMAFPRQREAHVYKQRLLPPDRRGESVDLMRLKKESIRQEIEKSLVIDSMAIETEN